MARLCVRLSRRRVQGVLWVGMDTRPRRTYTVTEVAQELGISRSTAYECVRTGEIPCIRLRSRIVVAAAVIDQMLSPTTDSSSDEAGAA